MDTRELIKSSINTKNFSEFEWFLVQYDLNPQKIIHKIVKSHDLIWSELLQNDNQEKDLVLIRDSGKLHLGYLLYKAKNYAEVIEQHKYIQLICKRLLHSPQELNYFMEHIHFNHDLWLLVAYSSLTVKEEQCHFAIFHSNNVVLKKDSHSNNIFAYIQENQATYKGVVFKISNDIHNMLAVMNFIRDDLLKPFLGKSVMDDEKNNREMHAIINRMEQRMHLESKLLVQAFKTVERKKTQLIRRLILLQNLANLNDVVD